VDPVPATRSLPGRRFPAIPATTCVTCPTFLSSQQMASGVTFTFFAIRISRMVERLVPGHLAGGLAQAAPRSRHRSWPACKRSSIKKLAPPGRAIPIRCSTRSRPRSSAAGTAHRAIPASAMELAALASFTMSQTGIWPSSAPPRTIALIRRMAMACFPLQLGRCNRHTEPPPDGTSLQESARSTSPIC